MVNKNLRFQNASSLNGPLEEFIENTVKCVIEYNDNPICPGFHSLPVHCVAQCLLDKYCGASTSANKPFMNCTPKQQLFIGISAGIIAKVDKRKFSA